MYMDDLGKLTGKEEIDVKSESQLLRAISSEPTDIHQAGPIPAGWARLRSRALRLQCTVLLRPCRTGSPAPFCTWVEREVGPGPWETESSLAPLGKGGLPSANISQGPPTGSSEDGPCPFASLRHLEHKVRSVNQSTVNICGAESKTICPQRVVI